MHRAIWLQIDLDKDIITPNNKFAENPKKKMFE